MIPSSSSVSLMRIQKYIHSQGHGIVNTACINFKVNLIIYELKKRYCKKRGSTFYQKYDTKK